ncbi:hypothetical protein ACLVWQ_17075 [Streptomyces sp. CWNU-52B]|uniref:hypothetical protein n=1 Tax=unclassified Streptomyces TaxID=2593676 RepID=UPI0039C22622
MAGGVGGGGAGGEHELALVEALGGLQAGAEPPMPDLVPGAVTRGRRIRRRRRIGTALGAVATAAAVAFGGVTLLAPSPSQGRSLPAAERTVWYPSLALLRSVVPARLGTVQASSKSDRADGADGSDGVDGSQRYFHLLDSAGGVSDLYVSVARTTAGLSPHPSKDLACRGGGGRVLTTPWGGELTKCGVVETKRGDRLLEYFVPERALPAPRSAGDDSYARGVAFVTAGGWTVQVILSKAEAGEGAKSEGEKGDSEDGSVPDPYELYVLATDPRLFDAVKETGG